MRPIFLLLGLIAATICRAQQPARIVFFRMDAGLGEKSSALGEWRVYTDKLLCDEVLIARMRSGSVFIYNTTNGAGTYAFVPAASGSAGAGTLRIRDLRGGIAFVKISLSITTPITAELKAVSLPEFEGYYKAAKWLRKRLADEGFESLEALSNGFHTRSTDSIQRPVTDEPGRRTPGDTLFFDRAQLPARRSSAAWYSTARPDSGGTFRINDYYLPENRLKSTYRSLSLDSASRDGDYTDYHPSGRLNSRGKYRANRVSGRWEFYRDTDPPRLWYTREHRENAGEELLTSYHPDGRVKRSELHRLYADTTTGHNGAGPQTEVVMRDTLISGRKYDLDGKEVPFTAFEIMPGAPFDIADYIRSSLRYPRYALSHGIGGRVIVEFRIDSGGRIRNARVLQHASDDLDKEALRVINAMPDWQPGLQDDVPVDVIFTLPIMFRLN